MASPLTLTPDEFKKRYGDITAPDSDVLLSLTPEEFNQRYNGKSAQQFEQPTAKPISLAEKAFKSFGAASAGVIGEPAAAAIDILGGVDTAAAIRKRLGEVQAGVQREVPELGKEFKFEDLQDPSFYATKGVSVLPALIALAGTGAGAGGVGARGALGAAKWIGLGAKGLKAAQTIGEVGTSALVSRTLEGALEASGTYNQLLNEGVGREKAADAAAKVFRNNYALTGLDAAQYAAATLKLPPALSKGLVKWAANAVKLGVASGSEGLEELYQGYVAKSAQEYAKGMSSIDGLDAKEFWSYATRAPLWQQEEFVIGSLFGLGFQVGEGALAKYGKTEDELRQAVKRNPQEVIQTLKGQADEQRADNATREQVAQQAFGKKFDDLTDEQKQKIVDKAAEAKTANEDARIDETLQGVTEQAGPLEEISQKVYGKPYAELPLAQRQALKKRYQTLADKAQAKKVDEAIAEKVGLKKPKPEKPARKEAQPPVAEAAATASTAAERTAPAAEPVAQKESINVSKSLPRTPQEIDADILDRTLELEQSGASAQEMRDDPVLKALDNESREVYAENERARREFLAKKENAESSPSQPTVAPSPVSARAGEEPQPSKTAVVEKPIAEIETDVDRFQNRATEFSEKTAATVAERFDPNLFDPIVLWRDPQNGKEYVLSGHSRLEGMKRRGAKNIPSRYFQGTEAEAMNFAKVEANRLGSAENLQETIKAYKQAKRGNATKSKLKDLFDGDVDFLESAQNLNESGDFIRYLGQGAATEFPYIKRFSRWVGELRKTHGDKLTDRHEQQVFDWLYKGEKRNREIEKDRFFELVEKQVSRTDFNPNAPLQLKRGEAPKIGTRGRADTAKLEDELDQLRADKKNARTPAEAQAIDKEIERVESAIKTLVKTQPDLFGEAEARPAPKETTTPTHKEFDRAFETFQEVAAKQTGKPVPEQSAAIAEELRARNVPPVIIDELTNPRRALKPRDPESERSATSRPERIARAAKPSPTLKPKVDAVAQANVDFRNKEAALLKAREEIKADIEARGGEVVVNTDTGAMTIKLMPGKAKISDADQALIERLRKEAAEAGAYSLATVGQGFEVSATPERIAEAKSLPQGDFKARALEFLKRNADAKAAEKVFKQAKEDARNDLVDHYLAERVAGKETPSALLGEARDRAKVEVMVRRVRSAIEPDLVVAGRDFPAEIRAAKKEAAARGEKGEPSISTRATGKKVLDQAFKVGTVVDITKPEFGAENIIVTREKFDDAVNRLRKKSSQLNVGIDPSTLPDLLRVGTFIVEGGIREFKAWSAKMLETLGAKVEPSLQTVWNEIKKRHPKLFKAKAEAAAVPDLFSAAAGDKAISIKGDTENNRADTVKSAPTNILQQSAKSAVTQGNLSREIVATKYGGTLPDGRKLLYKGAATRGGAEGVAKKYQNVKVVEYRDGNATRFAVVENTEQPIEAHNDTDSNRNLEPDREGTKPRDEMGKGVVPAQSGGAWQEGQRGVRNAAESLPALSGEGVSGSEAAATGEAGDSSPFAESPGTSRRAARGELGQRSLDFGIPGAAVESVSATSVERTAKPVSLVEQSKSKQDKADRVGVKPRDRANIDETLPILKDGQRDDVAFAEERFSKPDGYGVMFTNGTGTGKTFSGLGIIKRMARVGKDNIIIVVPSDKIAFDWVERGKLLNLNIKKLDDTKDNGGRGIVITTYSNFGQNNSLAKLKWDGIVLDEAHYLMQAKQGSSTNALDALRAISMHPRGSYARTVRLHSELYKQLEDYRKRKALAPRELYKEFDEAQKSVEKEVSENQGEKRPRVVFLSATPFAYEKAVDYAEGYLFDYPPVDTSAGYNQASGSDRFMVENFGYRMRYNKLTEPDKNVDRGLMQRNFNTRLKRDKVLSGRRLDVNADYDRRFVASESRLGHAIDEGLQWLWDRERMHPLYEIVRKKFDHLTRRYLLEAIKAHEVIKLIQANLDAGRKVVVFHDFKKGGAFNPFDIRAAIVASDDPELKDLIDEFRDARPDLIDLPIGALQSPITGLKKAFPDAMIFNGDVPKSERIEIVKRFQDDNSGKDIIIVQSAAGKEGISLHDTTGKKPRVLFNLGLPTQPTTAIQQEGRIYREGQASNAMFRYLNTGTNWERFAFAETIAQRSSAAENLALGTEARALLDAFIQAYDESGDYPVGHEGEGTGGKQADKLAESTLTDWDRAVALYYANQKKTGRDKSREGTDYFATPEPLGQKMVEWANIRPGDAVLEPSAGHGAIARWFPDLTPKTVIEPSAELASRLKMVAPEARLIQDRFENFHVVNKYDAVVMNPPFGVGGKTAIEHLDKAAKHLKDGGRIVAIIPRGGMADSRFDTWLYDNEETRDLYLAANINLPTVTFERAGTKVLARVVVIDKISDKEISSKIQQQDRDYSDTETIKDFFGKIKNSSIRERVELPSTFGESERSAARTSEMLSSLIPEPSAEAQSDYGYPIVEHTTAAGKSLRGTVRSDLSYQTAKNIDRFTFKKNGGWYIREKNFKALSDYDAKNTILQKPLHLREQSDGYQPNRPGDFLTNPDAVFEQKPYEPNYKKRPDATPRTDRLAKEAVEAVGHNRRRGRVYLANAINAEAREKGTVTLVGQTIKTSDDLAVLAQVYRDPRWETLRYVFVKGNEVVNVLGVSNRLPSASAAFPFASREEGLKWLNETMQKSGADSYYLLHNHPSGVSRPSTEDLLLTGTIAEKVNGFKGHVIIDSNEFSVINIDSDGKIYAQEKRKLFGEDLLLKPSIDHPIIGMTITRPESISNLISIGKMLEHEYGWVTLLSTDPRGRVRGVMQVEEAIMSVPGKRRSAIIRDLARRTGSSSVFAVVSPEFLNKHGKALQLAIERGFLRDAVTPSGFSVLERMRLFKDDDLIFGKELKAGRVVKEGEAKKQPWEMTLPEYLESSGVKKHTIFEGFAPVQYAMAKGSQRRSMDRDIDNSLNPIDKAIQEWSRSVIEAYRQGKTLPEGARTSPYTKDEIENIDQERREPYNFTRDEWIAQRLADKPQSLSHLTDKQYAKFEGKRWDKSYKNRPIKEEQLVVRESESTYGKVGLNRDQFLDLGKMVNDFLQSKEQVAKLSKAEREEFALILDVLKEYKELSEKADLSPSEKVLLKYAIRDIESPEGKRVIEKVQSALRENKPIEPSALDKVAEWTASMYLWRLASVGSSLVSNLFRQLLKYPELKLAAWFNQGVARQTRVERTRFSEEAEKDFRDAWTGEEFKKAAQKALDIMAEKPDAAEESKFFEREKVKRKSIGGNKGKIIRAGINAQAAIDVLFRQPATTAAISRHSFREAAKTSKNRVEQAKKANAIAQNVRRLKALKDAKQDVPEYLEKFEPILAKAEADAEAQTFQSELDGFLKHVSEIRRYPLARIFVPFFNTRMNILLQAYARTPLSAFGSEFRDLGAKYLKKSLTAEEAGRLSDRIAEITLGTAAFLVTTAALYGLSDDDEELITGDFDEKTIGEKPAGWLPNAVRVGDTYVSLKGFEPYATIFTAFGNAASGKKSLPRNAAEALAKAAFSNPMTDELFDIMGSLKDGDADKFFVDMVAGAATPGLLQDISKIVDPTIRQTEGLEERFKSRVGIPGVSATLPEKIDVFGEDLEPQTSGEKALKAATGLSISKSKEDPARREIRKLGLKHKLDAITHKGVELEPWEVLALNKSIGEEYHKTVLKLLQNPTYLAADKEARKAKLRSVRKGLIDKQKEILERSPYFMARERTASAQKKARERVKEQLEN